jgi:hypothetical protein
MPVCLLGSLQTRNETCNVPNGIAALHKKVLQLKIDSNTNDKPFWQSHCFLSFDGWV